MRAARVATWLLAFLVTVQSGVPVAAGVLEDCLALEQPAQKDCFERLLSDSDALQGALRELEPAAEGAPDDLLAALEYAPAVETLPAASAATLLELRARALLASDRAGDSAVAFRQALALDDGTRRLAWFSEAAGLKWEVALDVGAGRIVRAARAARAAGLPEESRDLFARALDLGWIPEDEGELAGVRLTLPESAPVLADEWHTPLPDVSLPLFDGGAFSVADARGKVVVLDFWASWCAPCMDELLYLQALSVEEKDRGLEVIAVNAQEGRETALAFANSLGLTLPIARYTGEAHRALKVQRLPTLIVADRQGRIRERWDEYYPGVEERVTERIRELLDSGGTAARVEIATALEGLGELEVAWSRELAANVGSLVQVDLTEGGERVLAKVGPALVLYRAGGSPARQWEVGRNVGSLRRGERRETGSYRLIDFRRGAERLTSREMPEGEAIDLAVPAAVLDVFVPERLFGPGSLLVATVDGLYRTTGSDWTPVSDFRETWAVAIAGAGDTARILALGADDEGLPALAWIDRHERTVGRARPHPNAVVLVTDPTRSDRVGAASLGTRAAVIGRLGPAGAVRAALAVPGQLLLIDPESGRVIFRARWKGIEALAAADLDGDGADELIVASGNRLTALRPGK